MLKTSRIDGKPNIQIAICVVCRTNKYVDYYSTDQEKMSYIPDVRLKCTKCGLHGPICRQGHIEELNVNLKAVHAWNDFIINKIGGSMRIDIRKERSGRINSIQFANEPKFNIGYVCDLYDDNYLDIHSRKDVVRIRLEDIDNLVKALETAKDLWYCPEE